MLTTNEARRPRAPVSGASLESLLASAVPHPQKVEALLAATGQSDAALPDILRRRLPLEEDPFVLATLVSCLGQCGEARDEADLRPLLAFDDPRVVANALEALRRLSIKVPAAELTPLLESPDTRVAINALHLIAHSDTTRALSLVKVQMASPDPGRRAGLGFLLGDLARESAATQILFDLLERETQTLVVKQLVKSLERHISSADAARIAQLRRLEASAKGAKKSLLRALVADLENPPAASASAVEEEEIESFSDVWGSRDPAPAPVPAPAPAPAPAPVRAPAPHAAAAVEAPPRVPTRAPEVTIAAVEPEVPQSAGFFYLATAVVLVAAMIGLVVSAKPKPAPKGAPAKRASGKPAAKPRSAIQVQSTPFVLGQGGKPVDVKGKLLAGSGTMISAGGHTFMIVAGPVPDRNRTGGQVHLVGNLVGVSVDGILFVEARSR